MFFIGPLSDREKDIVEYLRVNKLVTLGELAMFTGLSAQEPLVNSIEVRGIKRIEEGAVKSKISQKLGEAVSQEKTNDDIKSIFRMGYFEDVRVEIEAFEGGVKLIYIVKEKPTIIHIEFQGNKHIDDAKLKEKISITAGSIADTVLIQDNAVKLNKFYEEEGYWLSNVVPVVSVRIAVTDGSCLAWRTVDKNKVVLTEWTLREQILVPVREFMKLLVSGDKRATFQENNSVTLSSSLTRRNMEMEVSYSLETMPNLQEFLTTENYDKAVIDRKGLITAGTSQVKDSKSVTAIRFRADTLLLQVRSSLNKCEVDSKVRFRLCESKSDSQILEVRTGKLRSVEST